MQVNKKVNLSLPQELSSVFNKLELHRAVRSLNKQDSQQSSLNILYQLLEWCLTEPTGKVFIKQKDNTELSLKEEILKQEIFPEESLKNTLKASYITTEKSYNRLFTLYQSSGLNTPDTPIYCITVLACYAYKIINDAKRNKLEFLLEKPGEFKKVIIDIEF